MTMINPGSQTPGYRDPSTLLDEPMEHTMMRIDQASQVVLGLQNPETMQPLIRQRMIWDIAPDSQAAKRTVALGGHPASPDVVAAEQQAALLRRRALFPVNHLLAHFTTTAADVLIRSKVEAGVLAEPDDDEREDFTREVTSATLAVIANLLDLGVLTYGKAVNR